MRWLLPPDVPALPPTEPVAGRGQPNSECHSSCAPQPVSQAIAEPPKEKFHAHGHYTAEVDLTALEIIADCGVSPAIVSRLFVIFGNFYGVAIPKTKPRKVQTGHDAEGKRTYEMRQLLYIPSATHMKQLPAIGGELQKIQAAEWILEGLAEDASFCYIADGANSMQREILAQLLSRRNKETGKLESMMISLDEISDKSADGQANKYQAALTALSDAWAEADALGLLAELKPLAPPVPPAADATDAAADATTDAAAAEADDANESPAAFFERQRRERRAELRAKIKHLMVADCMNDRAAPARKAARRARGGDGSGGAGDVADTCTCAHHAVANIGEAGRKGMDRVLKSKMNISDEQADADAAKVKALRTNVGWFSSPACSLIYQVSKYVALYSSKGYAIGEDFGQWLAHKLKTTERQAGELIGHVEDLLSICGGRDYIFFLDAAVVERFSQLESLYGYLLEQADLGAEAGGKLRKAILTGFESVYCMAAVRSMAIISDAWLWPMLRAIEPGAEVHILDVCPALWPRCCAWCEEAAANPQSAIDGTLSLRASLEAANLRTTPRKPPSAKGQKRSERSQADLTRIRATIAADAELRTVVHELLTAAFTDMAAAVRNHAAEFMPGGRCCTASITPELRKAMDGTPLTSVGAETVFALVKRRADRGGISRHDTLSGAVACKRSGTTAWGRTKANPDGLIRLAAKRLREGSGKLTIADERALKGEAEAPEREAKLVKKRKGKAARAAELARLHNIPLISTYSGLKKLRNDGLSDQLKIWKKVEKKEGAKKTTGTRPELIRALQPLILEKFGATANDLEADDEGLYCEALKRKKAEPAGGKRKRKKAMVSWGEWEWDPKAEFIIERLIGRMVADGGEVPGRTNVPAGIVLYKVLWDGWPEEIATWEDEDDIPCGEVDFVAEYDKSLETAEADGAEADGDSSDDES